MSTMKDVGTVQWTDSTDTIFSRGKDSTTYACCSVTEEHSSVFLELDIDSHLTQLSDMIGVACREGPGSKSFRSATIDINRSTFLVILQRQSSA